LRGEEEELLLEVDVYRAAHLLMHEFGGDAELEAVRRAHRMLWRGDRAALLDWFRVWRTIALMRQAPSGLIH
jgi:hypothetical protein